MENKENILEQIKRIADVFAENNNTCSRADLAYELKRLGVNGDTAEVAALIWDAYKIYNNDSNIAKVFVGNSGRKTVVEEQEAQTQFQEGDPTTALAIIEKNNQSTSKALSRLDKDVNTNLEQTGRGATLVDYIMGTAGVKNIKETATILMNKYTEMTDAYGDAQDAVRASINDFVTIRSAILDVYRRYVSTLTDVFGHSVKSIAPELFDFNKVEYLDTEKMLQQFELEFKKVDDDCSALMSEIGDSFQSSLESSITDLRLIRKADKNIALVMAGLNMVNHYLQAADKSNRLESDYLQLKKLARKDISTIKMDMSRLFVINQVIDNTMLPKAQLFFRDADHLLNGDLGKLLDSLYSDPKIASIKEKRDDILNELKNVETELADHKRHIELYERLIDESNKELERKLPIYNEAKTRQPEMPDFIENIISFGAAKKNYARAMFDWNAACAPLVKSYDEMKNDVVVNQSELQFHKEAEKECQQKYDQLCVDLERINQKVMEALSTDNATKKAMLVYLKPIVSLLALAKEIITEKLDNQLLASAKTKDVETESMHRLVSDKVDSFSNYIQNEIAKNPTQNAIDEEAKKHISSTAEIVRQMLQLEIERDQQRLAQEQYDEQAKQYLEKMKNYLNIVNDKAEFIRKVAQKVNASDNPSKVKEAILKLCNGERNISEQEWDDFLSGKKNIII